MSKFIDALLKEGFSLDELPKSVRRRAKQDRQAKARQEKKAVDLGPKKEHRRGCMEASPTKEAARLEKLRKAALYAGRSQGNPVIKDGDAEKVRPTAPSWPTEPVIRAILKVANDQGIPAKEWEADQADAVWRLVTSNLPDDEEGNNGRACLLFIILEGGELKARELIWGKPLPQGRNTEAALKKTLLRRWVAAVARRAYLRADAENKCVGERWRNNELFFKPVDNYVHQRMGDNCPELRLLVKTESAWKILHRPPEKPVQTRAITAAKAKLSELQEARKALLEAALEAKRKEFVGEIEPSKDGYNKKELDRLETEITEISIKIVDLLNRKTGGTE